MAGKLENILSRGECIPEDMLIRYLEGGLSAHDNHLVEKHLLECEFCSDAVEGLKMIPASSVNPVLDDLHEKLDARIADAPQKGKVVGFSFYKMAAVVTLFILFGGGYLLLKNANKDKVIAGNDPVLQQVTDSIPEKTQPQFEPLNSTASRQEEVVQSAPVLALKKPNVNLTATNTNADTSALLTGNSTYSVNNDVSNDQNDRISPEEEVLSATQKGEAKDDSRSKETAREDAKSASGAPSITMSNMAVLDQSKREESVSMERKNSAAESYSPANLFTRAKANYDQKKYDVAANDFEKLINDSGSTFYDDSKWYLANCYIKLNKNIKSRKLLKEIAGSNSKHQKEAFGLLQESQ